MRRRTRLRLPRLRLTPASLFFLGVATLVAHISFSWMGFSPTDDGLVLAVSRRLVLAEVPHRDFISVLPVGSAGLHVLSAVYGGDHVHWLSRLVVWFQIAVIAWAWPGIIHRCLKVHLRPAEYQWTALVAFMLTASTFPMMAWPARDAVFLVTIGLVSCLQKHRLNRLVGYAAVGAAGLCEPIFVFFVPLTLGLMGGWKRPRYWLAALFPYAMYLAWLLLGSALGDAYEQLQALSIGFGSPQESVPHAGGLLLGLAGGALFGFWNYGKLETGALTARINTQRWTGTLGLYGLVGLAGMFLSGVRFEQFAAWILMGACFGIIPVIWLMERSFSWRVRGAVIVAVLCLCAALTTRHGTPALAAGAAAALLLGYTHLYSRETADHSFAAGFHTKALTAVALVGLMFFINGRLRRPYRERPASELNETLTGVLPGGSLLHTNRQTYLLMQDLLHVAEQSRGRRIAIIPPIPGFWVRSVYRNPLPLDWSLENEVARPEIVAKLKQSLDSRSGNLLIIVPKVDLATIAQDRNPVAEGPYAELLAHIRQEFKPGVESEYFRTYE